MNAVTRVLAALSFTVLACGGDGVDAPRQEPLPDCPGVDERLEGLYALLDSGQLAHIQYTMSVVVPEDARRDVVDTFMRLVRRFEPGAFESLAGQVDAADKPGLIDALAAALRLLATEGAGAPYPDALAALRGTLASCDGADILLVVADVLEDDQLLRALADALAEGGVPEALAGLEVDQVQGREALRILLRNLLVAASSPDFDARTLIDLLGFVVDLDAAPWPALVDGVERFLAPGPALEAVQGLLMCFLAVDPEASLGPPLFDLLTSDTIDLGAAVGSLPPAGEPIAAPEVVNVLTTALRFVAEDAEARRSLVAVLLVMLREDVGPGVLADAAGLLEADVVGDLLRLMATLATRTCTL
ncbi:MAG: hypothetical protein EP329_11750 [Deltaproteobacteria bacterium]|nr:MAG: hypothetical protein EP329_11750 [Deltaproteobacteria bacterium]